MPATNQSLSVSATWTLEETGDVAAIKQGPATVTGAANLPIDTQDEPVPLQYTILAAGTQVIDLYALTNPFGTAVQYASVKGILVRVAGTGAVLKIEPGASNALEWFLRGTSPDLFIDAGGAFALFFGTAFTVDATHRNLLLTNTGSGTATVTVVLFGGT